MSARELRLEATHFDGDVVVHTDPATAQAVESAAAAHEQLHVAFVVDELRGGATLRTDPGTTRQVAQAWATRHRADADVRTAHEVVALMRSAAMADAQRRTSVPSVSIARRLPTGATR